MASLRREATRVQLPLTSSITLEERKREADGAAHQYTSHPGGSRPQGWMVEVKGCVVAACGLAELFGRICGVKDLST